MVGSHLLDSSRSKANEILKQLSKQNGDKDEKIVSLFSDENSSPVATNDTSKTGIPSRSFYSNAQASRGAQLVSMSRNTRQYEDDFFGQNTPKPKTYSRKEPSSMTESSWISLKLDGRPASPVSSPRASELQKDSPRNVLGALAKFPTSSDVSHSDDKQKSSTFLFGKTPTRKPQSKLLGNRSYPSPSPDKEGSRKILGSISNHPSTELLPEDRTLNLFKLPPTIVQSYEIGFPNQGLTCYLNSVLQALLGVPDFLHDLLKLQQKIQTLPQDSSNKPVGLLGPFCRLAFVKNKGQQDDIATALNQLRAALVKSSPQFEGVHMQDAHEFLITFCDTFDSETIDFQKRAKNDEQDPAESLSPIDKNFRFKLQETKICQLCKHESSKITSDFILKLASPVCLFGSSKSVSNRLKTLLKRTLNSRPEMKCETCQSKGNVVHTLNEKFIELPKSLILYLPRTKYWTDDSEEKLKFAKNREGVEFQDVLYLDEFSVDAANLPTFVENSPLKLDFVSLKRRSSDPCSAESPIKKFRTSFISLLTPEKKVSEKLFSPTDDNLSERNGIATPSSEEGANETPVKSKSKLTSRSIVFTPSPPGSENGLQFGDMMEGSLMDFTNILNMSCNSSPAKPVSDIEFSTPTPTKLKNLTESDIEKLSDEDSLELAMRQSMKENKSVRRAIDMSPFGMSEDDQIAQAIQDSLRDSFETSPTINRDASLVNGTHDTSTLNGTSDAFSIDNFVRDVDSAGPSSLTPDNDTSLMDEERHTCDEKEKCNVSIMSTTSDSDENPDCSSISESGEREEKKKQAYRLIGVVSHLGGSAAVNSGHYVADVFSEKCNQWFRYDDMRVTKREKCDVISDNARDAYLFIYKFQS